MSLISQTKVDGKKVLFYALLSGLIFVNVLAGFGPSFVRAVSDSLETPLLIHIHATVFLGWIALFTVQALLPAFGHIDLHRKIGRFSIYYAVLLVVMGLMAVLNKVAILYHNGEHLTASNALLAPVNDMMMFSIVFTLAILFRKKPEIHKRLMVVGTVMLTIAAVTRISFIPLIPQSFVAVMAVWLIPIGFAMLYDLVRYRIIHPVYVLGAITMTIEYLRGKLLSTETYRNFADWFLNALTQWLY